LLHAYSASGGQNGCFLYQKWNNTKLFLTPGFREEETEKIWPDLPMKADLAIFRFPAHS